MTHSNKVATETDNIAFRHHDHRRCIDRALREASEICQRKGARLTALRKSVLELVWQSHKPLGAYTLLAMLADKQAAGLSARPAPPTVYRALEFLQAQGLIHKLNSLNAYIGCCSPQSAHRSQFLICQHCQRAVEIASQSVSDAIQQCADEMGFSVESETVEVLGTCSACDQLR